MSKWITGKDVARRLNLKDFEIFDYLASGELKPYSSVTGKKIKWDDFNRHDHVEAYNQKSFFNDYFFLKSDIESFELEHGTATKQAGSIIDTCEAVKVQGSSKPKTIAVAQKIPLVDADTFIRSLRIYYVTDQEIKIGTDGRSKVLYTREALGFKKAPKAWRELLKILKSSHHLYYTGTAHGADRQRRTTYDVNQKTLRLINDKILSFLNNTYPIQLPKGFKIYEHPVSERPGTYKFKFIIINNAEEEKTAVYDQCSRSELLKIIEDLSLNHGDKDSLKLAVSIAQEKEWLGKHRAKSYLNGTIEE